MVVLSRAELNRIKSSVSDTGITKSENVRRKKKELSDSRVENWPNTLAAQRKAKLDWKKESLQKEEAQRRKTDQEEATLQRKLRVDRIKKANQLMYEQTDKMKFLRSQQLYTDVIADRQDQVEFLRNKNASIKEDEKKWHTDMMARLEESERREKADVEKRKSKHKDIQIIQSRQLEDTKQNLIQKLKDQHTEGKLIKQMVQDDIVAEQKTHLEKQSAARKQNEEMLKANMNLKDLRKELLKVEQVESDRRKGQVESMDKIVKARAQLEKKHFEDRQRIRMRLIEEATKNLNALKVEEDRILEKHKEETEKAYIADQAMRKDRAMRQYNAIDKSRQLQIHLRKERAGAETKQAQILAEHWKERNAEIEAEQGKEAQDRWDKNWEIRRSQESQVKANKRKKAEERANELLRDEQTKAVMAEDDSRFRDFAQVEIDRFKARGKEVFLLERARDAQDIQMLAAKNK